MVNSDAIVVGGGLAGTEAAWQLAQRGIRVALYEMRPNKLSGAHLTENLAELVCSNSFGSDLPDRPSGLLKYELRRLGSLLLDCAINSAIPAGSALAVDRDLFSRQVSMKIISHPNIQVFREEVTAIPPGPVVIASGPLTSDTLANSIISLTGKDNLYFFDAVAPIISFESIDMNKVFQGSRYGSGVNEIGDYINCPFGKKQYLEFVENLISAKRIILRAFENQIEQGINAGVNRFFEGCLPVEIIAMRGKQSLAFGPMRPTGLTDPKTGYRPYAIIQLRQDDLAGTLYNMVGFQTNLTYSEQKRVFRMIPGLEKAEFFRYGQMHRNTFIASPILLEPSLQYRKRHDLFFAGQITGVEGYVGNIATGLLAGINLALTMDDQKPLTLPKTTMLGALCHFISHANMRDFQPMKANFGILPDLATSEKIDKRVKASLKAQRSQHDLAEFIRKNGISLHEA